MTQEATIFGRDLSRYDTTDDVQPAFVILNIEDPHFADKLARAVALGIPWGVYLWVYPGARLAVLWAMQTWRAAGHGDPPLGLWFDYEEAGVTPDQLTDGFASADFLGLRSGYYSSPGALDHGPFLGRDFWLAAYPGTNSGAYPGLGSLWSSSRPRDFVLWQYTSTNGTLDQDGVTDPAWFANTVHGGAPAADTTLLEDEMRILIGETLAARFDGDLKVEVYTGDRAPFGIPADAGPFLNGIFGNGKVAIYHVSDLEIISASLVSDYLQAMTAAWRAGTTPAPAPAPAPDPAPAPLSVGARVEGTFTGTVVP